MCRDFYVCGNHIYSAEKCLSPMQGTDGISENNLKPDDAVKELTENMRTHRAQLHSSGCTVFSGILSPSSDDLMKVLLRTMNGNKLELSFRSREHDIHSP